MLGSETLPEGARLSGKSAEDITAVTPTRSRRKRRPLGTLTRVLDAQGGFVIYINNRRRGDLAVVRNIIPLSDGRTIIIQEKTGKDSEINVIPHLVRRTTTAFDELTNPPVAMPRRIIGSFGNRFNIYLIDSGPTRNEQDRKG